MDPVEPSLHVTMKELLDPESLEDVLSSFNRVHQVPLRLFDSNGALMMEVQQDNKVCQYLNTLEKPRARCTVIRSKVKATVPPIRQNELAHIECFCGLRYTLASLVFQGEVVGKISIGPYFPADLESVPKGVINLDPNMDMEKLRDGMGEMRRIASPNLRGVADMIRTVIGTLLFSAHKAHVTNEMHLATVRESYRELMDKNRKLEEMSEERKEFDRKKSNFLAMVSHELRTPLTSIIGYSDMLTEGIAGELAQEQKQFVETIKTKGDELLKLISSILDFSKIDSGRLTLQVAPVDVRDLIERALAPNREVAARRGIKLSVDLPDNLPEATLDPEKIQTAISHIVDNGIKFSPPGGVVKVSARIAASSEDDGDEEGFGFVIMAAPDMVEITVEDFGMGIPDGDQSQIFAPFTQLDESSTREHGGAGIGLAIVKHYVEAHGGRVHVKSNVEQGSKFSIRIPLVIG